MDTAPLVQDASGKLGCDRHTHTRPGPSVPPPPLNTPLPEEGPAAPPAPRVVELAAHRPRGRPRLRWQPLPTRASSADAVTPQHRCSVARPVSRFRSRLGTQTPALGPALQPRLYGYPRSACCAACGRA